MKHITLVSCLLALACGFSPAAAQTGIGCPDQRATDVAAHIERSGHSQRCGVGVVILGLPLSVGGARCFHDEITYPAHQECRGEAAPGLRCATQGTVAVTLRRCECQWLSVLGTGVTVPKCSCSDAGNLGTIEDFQTLECSVVHG